MKFKRKTRHVEAYQWTDPKKPPTGIILNENESGEFYKSVMGLSCKAKIGDWVIKEVDGEYHSW